MTDHRDSTIDMDYLGNKVYRFKKQQRNARVNFTPPPEVFRTGRHGDCWSENDLNLNDDGVPWENHTVDENQLTVMTLPVEFMRRPSAISSRIRRDTQFQGTRQRRNPRAIKKMGDRNVSFRKIPDRSMRFCKDFVTTLIDEQWRYTLMVFGLSFFISWLTFAALWYLIALAHGDLDFDIKGRRLGEGTQPCIADAKSPASFFLFSIETQNTIGFGRKYPTEECPEAIFLMVLQSIIGVAIEGAMVGIVYAKMVRPPKRSHEMKFSKKAVVCLRDGKLCLLFRVCDARQTHVIATKVQAFWFDEKRSPEGKHIKQMQRNLKLENSGKMLLIWPVTVFHVIDENSPLFNYSAKDLLDKRFEIVVTITGSSRSTGQLTESRSSYIPKEIMWGHRFMNMVDYDYKRHTYVAHYDKFDALIPVDTPLCSASRLYKLYSEVGDYFLRSARNDEISETSSDLNVRTLRNSLNLNDITIRSLDNSDVFRPSCIRS